MRQVKHKGKKSRREIKEKRNKGECEEKILFFFEAMIETSKIQTKTKTFENTTCTIL